MDGAKSAKLYHSQTEVVQKQYGNQLLDHLPIKEGDIVCDIGCGCGNLAADLSKAVGDTGSVIAIDPDMYRIKIAKKGYGHMKNITFIAGKSVHIPTLQHKCYDSFISNAVLHWIPTDEKVITFKRMVSVLKPGGYFVGNISFNRSFNMRLASSMLSEDEQNEINNFYYRENPEILQQLLLKAGFEIVEFNYRYHEVNLGTIHNFLDWITSTYYGKFNFREAYNNRVKKDVKFEMFDNGDIKHTSEGAIFICRKPIMTKL